MNRTTLACSAALALIGACAPMASAEPWFRFSFNGGHRHGRAPVFVRHVPARHAPECKPAYRRIEVVPCDLRFTATQVGDTVTVVATGTNRTVGFSTAFAADRVDRGSSTLTLCNLSAESECAAQVMTPFSASTTFTARRHLRCITVFVAGQAFEVRVQQGHC